ncbi:predicted protein [Pyrenophora tritici-repentis Pt-1C-BFP]|uniref:Uncharacterized protein n=1 Tax=Pyrenophora tritici-repentis (strain Pt-1C-BFP) TaxID=426418 RepID=B2WNG0_PYRTR|nr:uncharacterized protein PTRG_11417 [Pyrenophora tritici-repentis Pt-1C-BFP]EDU44467.1 predicted protein [Pyrenophora tritici-repentis Pt-1C-BFP]
MKTFAAILLLATTCLVAAVPQGDILARQDGPRECRQISAVFSCARLQFYSDKFTLLIVLARLRR